MVEKGIIAKVWPQWVVQENLGSGAFGKVYKAVHKKFDVEDYAAIKVIPVPALPGEVTAVQSEGRSESETRQYFREIVQDFVKEIQLMLSLDGSSHIVSVKDYDVVEKEGEIGWYVLIRMELLTPYERYMQEHPMSEADVIRLGCDICSALEMCARQKVIHRDIKPANIMVHEATGNFKLGDFGVARKLENTTSGMTVAGARNYMAPEIIFEQRYNHRVDIYSLGLVLYRAMNRNRMPFVPLNGMATYQNANEGTRRRMSGEPLPPPCDASPELAEVILKACAFKPEDRFATAAEMRQALEQVKNGTLPTQPAVPVQKVVAKQPEVPVQVKEFPAIQEPEVFATSPAAHEYFGEGAKMVPETEIPVRIAPAPVNVVEEIKRTKNRNVLSSDYCNNASGRPMIPPKKVIIGAVCAVCAICALIWLAATHFMQDESDFDIHLKAANLGRADAQYAVGNCYYNGDGVTQDHNEAVKWYLKSAEQGYADAQYALGNCYYNGNDYAEAVGWYLKAAEQGHIDAQYKLGDCYYNGNGVVRNYTEAMKWYRKAAEQGHLGAQHELERLGITQ